MGIISPYVNQFGLNSVVSHQKQLECINGKKFTPVTYILLPKAVTLPCENLLFSFEKG